MMMFHWTRLVCGIKRHSCRDQDLQSGSIFVLRGNHQRCVISLWQQQRTRETRAAMSYHGRKTDTSGNGRGGRLRRCVGGVRSEVCKQHESRLGILCVWGFDAARTNLSFGVLVCTSIKQPFHVVRVLGTRSGNQRTAQSADVHGAGIDQHPHYMALLFPAAGRFYYKRKRRFAVLRSIKGMRTTNHRQRYDHDDGDIRGVLSRMRRTTECVAMRQRSEKYNKSKTRYESHSIASQTTSRPSPRTVSRCYRNLSSR